MTGIQASGVGSGLDVASLVSQLVAAERAPLDARITRQKTTATNQISALGYLKSGISTLRDALANMRTTAAFATRSAISSATDIFTATAAQGVQPGSYDIEVSNLATAHKLASDPFLAGRDAVVGTGTLTITYGSTSFDVVVDATHNTLASIRDAINAATGNGGVTAGIVNEVGGSRLVLTSRTTGVANVMTVKQAGGDGGLAALVFDPAAPLTTTLTETAASDALIHVNGYAYQSATNTVTGAIDGLTLTLKKADLGVENTLTIANDTTATTATIKKFVADYNNLAGTFKNLQGYDASTGTAGPMLGDAYVRGLESNVRRGLTNAVSTATGSYTSLASIGITTDSTGKLVVNDAKLAAALGKDFDGVASMFASSDGVAARLYQQLDAALGSEAQIAVRNVTLNAKTKQLAKEQAVIDDRMTSVEKRYRAQFTALDTLLTQMQTTSAFLTQQLAASNSYK